MKEVRVIVRVKNNRLLERREGLGVTQAMMAEVVGMSLASYAALENVQLSPVNDGEWIREARQLAEYYDCDPEELFPEAVLAVREPVVERRLDTSDLTPLALSSYSERMLLTPDDAVLQKELHEKVGEALSTLRPREKDVLTKLYGLDGEEPMTAKEVADSSVVGPAPARLYQIADEAVGRLSRGRCRDFIDGEPVDLETVRKMNAPHSTAGPPEFDSVVALVDGCPGTLDAVKRVRAVACATWPKRVRILAEVSSNARRQLNLYVVLPTSEDVNLVDAAMHVMEFASTDRWGHQKKLDVVRVFVKKHDYLTGKTKGLRRLADDARAGGFAVVSCKSGVVCLGIEGARPREELFRMRLWFGDRAVLKRLTREGAYWSLVKKSSRLGSDQRRGG